MIDQAAEVIEPAATLENVVAPEDSTPEDQEVKEAVAKTFTQDELNDIVQREKAKAEAKAERRAMKTYREMQAYTPAPQQQQAAPDKAPSRDAYASDEAWLDARDAYRDAKKDAQANNERQQASKAQLEKKTEGLYSQAEKISGFDRDAFEDLPLTPAMAGVIIESDIAPQLMHYMASNPNDVDRISALSPARQAVEIGKLEVKLQTAAVKQSKAPPPITPIGAASSKGSGDLSRMSMDDYIAQRLKDKPRWAR